jgi:hypothetical protein
MFSLVEMVMGTETEMAMVAAVAAASRLNEFKGSPPNRAALARGWLVYYAHSIKTLSSPVIVPDDAP